LQNPPEILSESVFGEMTTGVFRQTQFDCKYEALKIEILEFVDIPTLLNEPILKIIEG